jgi:hypothetical protein
VHDQKFLNHYFKDVWCPSTDKYIYSGYAIVDKIPKDAQVLDVGCGSNPFKGHIKNLIGIDPAHSNADIQTTIEEYTTDQRFDVALCLGSINFGNESIIAKQIECVNNLLNHRARIYWRLNPGQHDHNNAECNQIDFFPWTFEKLYEYACRYNFQQIDACIDNNGLHDRLYAEWWRD